MPQSALPLLKDLDMFNCPVTDLEEFRGGLFSNLGSLKWLDGTDK